MPQISKVRIVNFQYNDGRRLIADELYDFESENRGPSDVLINLANGGGKSVLVQLMMQPVIPKARVAGRRIESFFTRASDHCYVVLEWTLDDSRRKLMTGIAMAASDSSADADADRGFQIRYYTFLSGCQDDRGPYDIISLPLSKRENGRFLPAPFDEVRNLAKKSAGALERYSSEDSVKWQERLAGFGIVQNEWHMIEKLNSNEDGLSRFFGELKTSDRVIDELILPRIEEKQARSGTGDDSSLETMLISYAKQFSRQQDIIREREICSGFYAMLETAKKGAEELWENNDRLVKCVGALFAYRDALDAEIAGLEKSRKQSEEEKAGLLEEIRHIRWEKASSEFYLCRKAFEDAAAELESAGTGKAAAEKKREEAGRRLLLFECAHYFEQLKKAEARLKAVTEEMEARENSSEDAARLASLKYSAQQAITGELQRAVPETEKASGEKSSLEASVSVLSGELAALQKELEAAKTRKDRAEAVLDTHRRENDRLAEELGISAIRSFIGKYQDAELRDWQRAVLKKEEDITGALVSAEKKLEKAETRKDAVPQETAEVKTRIRELAEKAEAVRGQLAEYRAAEEQLKAVFEKHGLEFGSRFTEEAGCYFAEQLSLTAAAITAGERETEGTEEEIAAVERGSLHIPGRLTEFLDHTGIRYTTVEKYILAQQEKGLLTREECMDLLERYPFAAYGVLLEKRALDTLLSETEGRWLPAVLPVFTAEDLESMMRGEEPSYPLMAAYSREYFRNSASYRSGLRETLERLSEKRKQLEERRAALEQDAAAVSAFSGYDAASEDRLLSEQERLEQETAREEETLRTLQAELEELKGRIGSVREEIESLREERNTVRNRLAAFEGLLKKLEEEDGLEEERQAAWKKLRELQETQRRSILQKAEQEARLKEVTERLKELKQAEEELKQGLEKVSGAACAKIREGDWKALLAEYEERLGAQSEDLRRLREEKDRLLGETAEKRKEIAKRNCSQEEFAGLSWTEEKEQEAAAGKKAAEDAYRAAEEKYSGMRYRYGKAESSLKTAEEHLKEFGGEALPAEETGGAFEERISGIREKLSGLEKRAAALEERQKRLSRVQGSAENAAAPYIRPEHTGSIFLEADPAQQLKSVLKQIREREAAVTSGRKAAEEDLKKMADAYGAGSSDVSRAIAGMRELLLSPSVQGDRYYTLCEHMDASMHTTALRISQIDTDLKEFNRSRGDLIRQCVIQGRQMYEGLQQLSDHSRVRVQEKRRPMLKFDIPDAVDENVASASIAAEIERGTREIAEEMEKDTCTEAGLRRLAGRAVGSRRLLRRYTGSENIVLKAYKIDRNPENSGYRTWEQTQVCNSGAEKFVVYFAVILALMAYTREEYGETGMKGRSVLILDNPFGPISSKHVLEPMFEISRNYHVQMVCLSDISKTDIVACFDLVIRAVVKQFALSTKEQLTHEGNELIEHGFYRSEQLSLFRTGK